VGGFDGLACGLEVVVDGVAEKFLLPQDGHIRIVTISDVPHAAQNCFAIGCPSQKVQRDTISF